MTLRNRSKLLALIGLTGLLVLLAFLVNAEFRSSRWQARYLSRLGRELTFQPEVGPSPSIRFPKSGPYDERLGYSKIPAFTQFLSAHDYLITDQARLSPRLAELAEKGLSPAYQEKTQAGLDLLDCNRQSLYSERFPEHRYDRFQSVPRLLVDALLFIEDRELLSTRYPLRNPAFDWSRFGKAVSDQFLHVFNKSHQTPGASTLVTQIEKYRHSPEGRTASPQEKLRQMASASVRVYLNGENTLPTRQQIVVDYLNTVPLAAMPGYGEISGLGDGLRAWYGRDFAEVNQLLASNAEPTQEAPLRRRAEAFKQALSLMIAQRRPSYYLREGAADLAQLTDSHLRALAAAGIIPVSLRDAALPIKLNLQQKSVPPPPVSFVTRKAVTALRTNLSGLLHLSHLYDLDRLDLSASTTMNGEMQRAVTTVLRQLQQPSKAKAADLYGHNMLSPGDDPSKLIFSFTLFEQRGGANLLRVQTDNFDQPFDINEGARLNLGSTAKLRTLITYLEIIADLHQRYARMTATDLGQVRVDKENVLSLWGLAYLAQARDRGLPAMLEAAMERRYSGSPGEGFVTGGGVQTFSNFEAEENYKVMTVREGFQQSVNLVFVRLMRDVVRHYKFKMADANSEPVDAQSAPRRQQILARFADKEGRQFMLRFYKKYQGKTPQEAQQLLLGNLRPSPARLATVFRSVQPNADLASFSALMREQFPKDSLLDARLKALYEQYGPDKFSLADRGYIAGVHPLELWLLEFMRQHPEATLTQTLDASRDARQDVYAWLFKTHNKNKQDKRIRQMLELEAFLEIGRDWRRLGYPFESLTPSYASALGASGDRPAALAELMGIIVNKGMRLPLRRLPELDFAKGTPYETHFANAGPAPERLLPEAITDVVRRSLIDVVEGGTAKRLKGGLRQSNGTPVEVGGKTGTGDHRFEVYAPGGKLISSRAVNRSATFVFLIGDRFFGTMTAYVHEPYAAKYKFTSAISVQLLKSLTPTLLPMMQTEASDTALACQQ
ncbi:MAG: penicillin-binding protein [Polaromonas sp.]|uniref:transglycosylase domain-containing protein n=1 Tax=Polaromonas sp. TaxID=1869339 RepID=UPI00182538AF|nr:transglycosylase domain-containing protein [Polaromonas sp.]NMM10629.1 penicillin-binding protein [Polaromonas sp.]